MHLIFLTNQFYLDFNHYKEILIKNERPYIMLIVCYNNHDFAIPFRSNIKHSNYYKTSDTGGIDYTKSIIVTDKKYIDNKNPILRDNEFKVIKGKEFEIKERFITYINRYKKHIEKLTTEKAHIMDYNFCKYSTLQNYHSFLGIDKDFELILEIYSNQKRE